MAVLKGNVARIVNVLVFICMENMLSITLIISHIKVLIEK